ncbi:unnamed protein product [Kluyveromyces dobzhanskii CBS 2104]|uniref:WGS project CCBQ000000000 data, contig 00041 n=1 Tax=Kluyveromyces dobzhanskii CBS 2104 TaxID=1427455 RepID=A0A0A8L2C7_9SACH|nr:unnamed protein product [Kluyveromyces dobzhanskii CBS 2104]
MSQDEKKQYSDEKGSLPEDPPTYVDVLNEDKELSEERAKNAAASSTYEHQPHPRGNCGYPGVQKTSYNNAGSKSGI